ncbi:O-methylsterigmatocystin oxidoreductase [Coprinopsis sp. MPI-PUGE-AT-0042]|nr:O-methylsterigmatocystin oxidoreductase [Coprinopsis sp. MPI-PUGE-AT-0042]
MPESPSKSASVNLCTSSKPSLENEAEPISMWSKGIKPWKTLLTLPVHITLLPLFHHMATNPDLGRPSLSQTWSWLLVLLTGLLLSVIYASRLVRKSDLLRLARPPGPKGLPIFGNLLQIHNAGIKSWLMYNEWAQRYGDLVYADIFGQPILVLNSLKCTRDLLEKRGSKYADRAVLPSISFLKADWFLGNISYGSLWRAHRRMFHQYYNKTQIHKYSPVIEHQVAIFLRRLRSDPKCFLEDTRWLFGAIIIQISYGFNNPADIESLSKSAETIVKAFSDCVTPGHFLVDVFPILRYVPTWFPGAAWQRRLIEVGKINEYILHRTFDDAQEQAKGSAIDEAQDVASRIIANLPPKDHPGYAQQEQLGRRTIAVAYIAGADTTVSSAHALFAALANHPECQRMAHAELDEAIGTERLPTVSDLPQLPYVQALVKEVSRWFSVTPMGIPHILSQDDTYEGYFIPKGTLVMGNSWAIMHDPNVFEDPLEFKPERYLMRDPITQQAKINPDVLDPESAAFGYGRRICPGRHLSNEAMTLMAASLLAVFTVDAPKDLATGQPVKIKLETGDGIVVTPAPFEVDISPRSARHPALASSED